MSPFTRFIAALLLLAAAGRAPAAEEGAFVRFRLDEPTNSAWHARISGYVHVDPWSLPGVFWPAGAQTNVALRLPAGTFAPWFDLREYAGKRLHGRHTRAGGIAEFPNLVLQFIPSTGGVQRVTIELATAPDSTAVVKRVEESYTGDRTSILISPTLARDAAELETAGEMSARRLAWAREATGGIRHSPSNLILQTGLWYPQRTELNLQEAEVLRLLGFNTVGGQTAEIRELGLFAQPGHHWIHFGPGLTREGADEQMRRIGEALRKKDPAAQPGSPYNFSDEVTAPAIGTNAQALAHFRAWLKERKIRPRDLGATSLDAVLPIETPDALRAMQATNRAAANRLFYYSSRFRQESATERLRWLTELFHRHVGTNALTSTLPADHPYFAGTGLGMGMGPNPAWGSTPLALDWFDLGRRWAVDLMGIEDWMGLQYMYGPNYTWEGFQLMGFQAALFRSASRGEMPIIAWVTPSDATNLTLKSTSALCQGAKHLFFWTYGPTAFSTENYWSDLRSAYDGMAALSRRLAFAERILAPGRLRTGRVAVLYSIASDLWQPFGYVHMLERRQLYLALTHAQIPVDLLAEEDVLTGRLSGYDVVYTADPCLREDVIDRLLSWVKSGGYLVGTCAAGLRNEFDEPVPGLGPLFGLSRVREPVIQSGPFHRRAGLNEIPALDRFSLGHAGEVEAIGVRVPVVPEYRTTILASFTNGEPAVVTRAYGRGKTLYVATCPGIAYAKAAGFVARELKEQWPAELREFLVAPARERGGTPPATLSEAVVETGVYDAPGGSALVLANFGYRPITDLAVSLTVPFQPGRVESAEAGVRPFQFQKESGGWRCFFSLPLNLADIVLVEP